MPYSIVTDDGIQIDNIPDNVDRNSEELRNRVASIRQSPEWQSAQKGSAEQPTQQPTQPTSAPVAPSTEAPLPSDYRSETLKQSAELARQYVKEPLNRGAGLAGRALVEGTFGTVGLVSDPIAALITQALPEGSPKQMRAREIGAQLSDILGLPKPETSGERVVQSAAEAVAGGVPLIKGGQLLAKAATPLAQKAGQFLSAAPAAQGISAAAGGAAAQGVQESGGSETGQLLAGLAAGVLAPSAVASTLGAGKAVLAGRTALEQVAPETANLLKQAGQQGIDVLTTDILQPKTAMGKFAQRTAERIPFVGTGDIRKVQQQQRVNAVQNVLQEYGAIDTTGISGEAFKTGLSKKVFDDIVSKRSSEVQNATKAKQSVINELGNRGVVPMPNTLTKIDEQIASLRARRTDAADEAASILEQFKVSDASGLTGRTLPELESFRSDVLANVFKDDPASKISIGARDIGTKAIRSLYDSVRQDMGDFIRQNGKPNDYTKWQMANKKLYDISSDVEVSSFKNLLRQGNATPELAEAMLYSKKPSEVKRIYESLSAEGRNSAKSLLLNKAAKNAQVTLPDGSTSYNPQKFNTELKALSDNLGVFFQGDEAKRLNGLSRLLDVTSRAGEAGVLTSTGQEAVPFVLGSFLTNLFGGTGRAVGGAATIGLGGRAYESKAVRNLLIKLNATRPGSKAEKEISNGIFRTLNTVYQSQQSVQNNQQQPTGMQQ
jgi:hypothetical protein